MESQIDKIITPWLFFELYKKLAFSGNSIRYQM